MPEPVLPYTLEVHNFIHGLDARLAAIDVKLGSVLDNQSRERAAFEGLEARVTEVERWKIKVMAIVGVVGVFVGFLAREIFPKIAH